METKSGLRKQMKITHLSSIHHAFVKCQLLLLRIQTGSRWIGQTQRPVLLECWSQCTSILSVVFVSLRLCKCFQLVTRTMFISSLSCLPLSLNTHFLKQCIAPSTYLMTATHWGRSLQLLYIYLGKVACFFSSSD